MKETKSTRRIAHSTLQSYIKHTLNHHSNSYVGNEYILQFVRMHIISHLIHLPVHFFQIRQNQTKTINQKTVRKYSERNDHLHKIIGCDLNCHEHVLFCSSVVFVFSFQNEVRVNWQNRAFLKSFKTTSL